MTKGGKTDAKKQTPTPTATSATKVEVHSKPVSPSPVHSLGLFEQLSIAFLVIAFTVFAGFKGVWFFHHKEIANAAPLPDSFNDFHALFQTAWKNENPFSAVFHTAVSLIKSVWKANAITDRRLATDDLTYQTATGISYYFLAPLTLVLAYGIAHRRKWRLSLQLVVSTVALATIAFVILAEYFNGFSNINTKGDQHLAVAAVTAAFYFPIGLLFLQSFFGSRTGVVYPRSHRISFTVKFLLGSVVAGVLILAAASIGHHYFDSTEVRAALKSGLEYSQIYANHAYESASAVASEAAHQAHVLAAPYIDQAAEFIHDNLGSK